VFWTPDRTLSLRTVEQFICVAFLFYFFQLYRHISSLALSHTHTLTRAAGLFCGDDNDDNDDVDDDGDDDDEGESCSR